MCPVNQRFRYKWAPQATESERGTRPAAKVCDKDSKKLRRGATKLLPIKAAISMLSKPFQSMLAGAWKKRRRRAAEFERRIRNTEISSRQQNASCNWN